MAETRALLQACELLTPADHQTHRRYRFSVPDACTRLSIHVRYAPKLLSAAESGRLVSQVIRSQAVDLAARVGQTLTDRWSADFEGAELIVPNLLTISLDDAEGAYRGAGHRHTQEQELEIAIDHASPGLVAGPLAAGEWTLTLSAHTLVSAQCEVEIQIGAETASSRP